MTLDERVFEAIQQVHHEPNDSHPQYIAAFTEKGREKDKYVYGNRYRWLLDEHGNVYRWQRYAIEQVSGKKGRWVQASKRMTIIVRMKVWPDLTFE